MQDKFESIIYSIERGKIPLQIEPIMLKNKQQLLNIAKDREVILRFEDLAEGWQTVYTYKNPLIKDLIKLMPPKTGLEHMALGLLLGYDLKSIHEFYTKKVY